MHRPVVFIGSAAEHEPILDQLSRLDASSYANYIPWTRLGVFAYSGYTLPSLCRFFDTIDGAVFLSLSVDKTWWRGEAIMSPRDNVIFEAGLAIGYLGVERTAIVTDSETKLPSDLKGLTTILYRTSGNIDRDVSDLHSRLEHFFAEVKAPRGLIRKVWEEDEYSIYFHSFDNPEKGEFEEIVNFNAVRAVGFLTDMFGRHGIQYSLHSSRLEEVDVEASLVLLGSSASNRLTKQLCGGRGEAWRFDCVFDAESMNQRHILDRADGRLFPPVFDGGRLSKDYGILTKIRSPFNKRQWIFIASGNYGFGTLAALRVVIDQHELASLPIKLDGQFQLLVEVSVTGRFNCGKPHVVSYVELS